MRFALIYSDIEMCLRVSENKLDDIRPLYAAIVMKKSAGCAEDWELELTNVFDIDWDSGIFNNDMFIHFDWGHGLGTLNGEKIYRATTMEIGNYPERYLLAISPFLEDGYIKIVNRGYCPNGDDRVRAFAVKDGKLYELLDSDGFIFWGGRGEYKGNSYEIGERIMNDARVKDSNYGKVFHY